MYSLHVVGVESKEELKTLWVDSFMQAYDAVHSPENLRAYCSQNFTSKSAEEFLTDDKTVCILASRDGSNVGLCVVKHHNCPVEIGENASELKQLYLLASEYGTGLGKLMMEDACKITRNAGNHWIWLCVSGLNYRAQTFYKKFGFSEIGIGPTLEVGTDRLPSLIMSLRL